MLPNNLISDLINGITKRRVTLPLNLFSAYSETIALEIDQEILEKKYLEFENINSTMNTLLKKTRDKIKSRGSIVNEINTRGDFIKKTGDYIKINQKNKYLLEVVSLRDSKTAEAIIVELNVTGL